MIKRNREWIITLSEGIWPVISCWDLQVDRHQEAEHVGEWFCKGALIQSVAVDKSLSHDPLLAVSVNQYSRRCVLQAYAYDIRLSNQVVVSKKFIEIQEIRTMPDAKEVNFATIKTIDTDYTPVLLDGDILVISDEFSETRVMNWRTGRYAILRGRDDPNEVIQVC